MNLLLVASVFLMAPAFAQETTYTSLSDGQIADVLKVANKGEIESAKHAKSHATHPEVKAYAKKLVDDHEKNKEAFKKLSSKIKLKEEESDLSKSLEASHKEEHDRLKDLKGKDFDQAFIQAEVTDHENLINTIDKSLLPSAKNAELKSLLEKTRESISAHLAEAKRISSSI